jgi:hypothetical protein
VKKYGFKVTGCLKSDFIKLARKIQQNGIEGEQDLVFRVTDMIRATIVIKNPAYFQILYQEFKSINQIKILRIEDRLDEPIREVVINFLWGQ